MNASRDNQISRGTRQGGALRSVNLILLVFLVHDLSSANNITGVYRHADIRPYLDVQGVASWNAVCAFIVSLTLDLEALLLAIT